MARTVEEIQELILESKKNIKELDGLNSTSKVSIWRLYIYVIALCTHILERMFDNHKIDVNQMILNNKPHTQFWYKTKALGFQYGFNLLPDTDLYDNSAHNAEDIEKSKIIKHVAVYEANDKSILYVKIAKETGSIKTPLLQDELEAFTAYIRQVADAGVRIYIINAPADKIKIELDIYYNPQVLNSSGQRNDGMEANPIQDVVKKYLSDLEFNGIYANMNLIDRIQEVEGVELAEVRSAYSRYGEYDWQKINIKEISHSGYYEIADNDLIINYLT